MLLFESHFGEVGAGGEKQYKVVELCKIGHLNGMLSQNIFARSLSFLDLDPAGSWLSKGYHACKSMIAEALSLLWLVFKGIFPGGPV